MSVPLKNAWTQSEFSVFLQNLSIDAELSLESNLFINSISDGRSPIANSIVFLEKTDLVEPLDSVLYIVPEKIRDASCIVTDDPRYVFIKFLELIQINSAYLSQPRECVQKGIHPSALIANSAVIEEEVVVEEGAVISAGVVLKKGTYVGAYSIIRENTVVGCPGIALYKAKNGEVLRFPHLSGVKIGGNVEIGANAVLVQGTLKPTIIENDVVIGNLCNIGHGVVVKEKVWMSVGTLVGGNCTVEPNATLGLGVAVKDNLSIANHSSIGMGSVVTKSTSESASYFGNPAKPLRRLKTGPAR